MGGDHTHILSSGHNRWSVHAMNMGNPLLLETHRGEPHVVIHPGDAAAAGIDDHDPGARGQRRGSPSWCGRSSRRPSGPAA